jgi:glycosyltransferase involved in cell wall biosynthesis
MKILLVHNHYGSASPSGENSVFEMERAMLERHGHEVQAFERHSDEIRTQGVRGLLAGALATPWNPFAVRAMRKALAQFRPDVIHAHNTFPLISPAIFPAARGVGRVLTLHNYRLFCPAAIPMRDGRVCTDCLDNHSVMPALRYGCYRGSRVATLPMAANVALQRKRGTWRRDVEAFIALTEFQKDRMVQAGLPVDKVFVKPNFYAGDPAIVPIDERPNRVVFVGRLSAEKGVGDLLTAWLKWGPRAPELMIIGDGPLREALVARAANAVNIRFCGQLSGDQAKREIGVARLIILPSRWFEGFPMVLREAFALGTPSLVSNLGPLPSLVAQGQGAVFQGGDAEDLGQKAKALWADNAKLNSMSKSASAAFKKSYTEEVNSLKLMDIYNSAIALSRVAE